VTIYDVSVPIRPHMPVYPGDPAPRLSQAMSLARGHVANVGLFAGSLHTGTHVDAPYHFIADGAAADALPVEAMIGPATVVAVETAQHITVADLALALGERRPSRLLLKTRNSTLWAEDAFQPDYVALTAGAAEWLVSQGVALVGVDYISVDPYPSEGFPVHRVLLGAGIVIIEALDLREVPPGDYTLTCLPLRIVGADAAPARVILTSL